MTRSETDRPIDRQTLYEEVWKEPVSIVAPRYGLSDVGLAKICRSLAIPLPSRGYWAMVKAGRTMKRVPLPASDEKKVLRYLAKLPADQVVAQEEAKKNARRIRQEVTTIALPHESTTQHPLVKSTSKRLRQRDGWSTDTKLRSMPSEVLNISVTLDSLDRALQITDVLLKALEEHGITVHIDSEKKITLLKVKDTETEMTFSLVEQIKRTVHEVTPSEERARKRYFDGRMNSRVEYPSIPRYDYHPTGIFSICAGHWPSRTWNDTPKTSLEKRLGEVVAGILVLAKETHAKEVEDARKKEERLRAQQHYEFLVKRRESETARLQHLEAQAGNWERAERLRNYANAVEQYRLSEGMLNQDVQEWLVWTRAKADSLDPLVLVSDPILDAPEPKSPSYW